MGSTPVYAVTADVDKGSFLTIIYHGSLEQCQHHRASWFSFSQATFATKCYDIGYGPYTVAGYEEYCSEVSWAPAVVCAEMLER